MKNLSDITLSEDMVVLRKKISNVRKSLGMLTDKTTDYAEHHQHLINTYLGLIGILERAIVESGTGTNY